MTPRRARATLVAALALGTIVLGACTDDGDKDAFCERLADTPALGDTLGALDASDPGGAQRELQQAARQFRRLESDAPGEVKEDIARVRRGVDLILEAVEAHPDDLSAARAAILEQSDEVVGLAAASADLVSYAQTECGLDLQGLDPAGGIAPGGATGSSAPTDGTADPGATTTTGG